MGGWTNSGNFSAVTTGTDTGLGAHALTTTTTARAHFLILEILHPVSVDALRGVQLGGMVSRLITKARRHTKHIVYGIPVLREPSCFFVPS